jgi:CheY-like chemotaxis protein
MGQSMSRILILRDPPRSFQPLRTCLEDHHELHFVDSTEDALLSLHESQFDLIICSAHLYDSSAFSFIQTVKNHDSYRQVPLICFSGERSKAASIITKTTEHTALLVGADKYLGMDSFCASGCHETCRSCPIKPHQEGSDGKDFTDCLTETITYSKTETIGVTL